MQKGDLVLLARTNAKTKTTDRLVGEIVNFVEGCFVIKTNLLTLRLNPKSLKVMSDDSDFIYRYSGIVK